MRVLKSVLAIVDRVDKSRHTRKHFHLTYDDGDDEWAAVPAGRMQIVSFRTGTNDTCGQPVRPGSDTIMAMTCQKDPRSLPPPPNPRTAHLECNA